VSREEYQAAVARLDAADAELRTSLIATERALRGEFLEAVSRTLANAKEDAILHVATIEAKVDAVDNKVEVVDEHLSWQNRTVGAAILSGIVTFVVLSAIHVIHFG
jgi:hypothetical protein